MPKEYRKQAATFEMEMLKTALAIASAAIAGTVTLMSLEKREFIHEVMAGISGLLFLAMMYSAKLFWDRSEKHLDKLREDEENGID